MFYRNFQQKQNISLTENNQNRLSKLPDTISEASLKHNETKMAIFFFFSSIEFVTAKNIAVAVE